MKGKLLEQLQTIKHKLDNKQKLTDYEYKIFTSVMFGFYLDVVSWSLKTVLKVMEVDKDE